MRLSQRSWLSISRVHIYFSFDRKKNTFKGSSKVFCYAGHFRKCRRDEPCRGVCIPLQKIFIFGGSQTAIFSTCHEICLRKIDLEYENGKQLQVTIIKITESKENKSIHRLVVSSSKGPGGQLRPPCPPLAMSLTYLVLTKRPSSF